MKTMGSREKINAIGGRRHRYRSIRQQQQFAAYMAGLDK